MTEVQTLNNAAIRICLDARAESLLVVRRAIEGAVRAHGIDGRLLDDLKLAVTEASSNVVKYAYPDGSGKLWVELDVNDHEVRVAVCDTGRWRAPTDTTDREASGMGIPLIEAVADSAEFNTDDGGTRVVMVFARPGRESAAEEPSDD